MDMSTIKEGIILKRIDNTWTVIQDDKSTVIFKTHPISEGELLSHRYRLSLRINANSQNYSPFMVLMVRDKQAETLPREIRLLLDDASSTEIANCQTEPVYSILHKDYVSLFRFPIKENDFLQFCNNRVFLCITNQDDVCRIALDIDDAQSVLQLKEQLLSSNLSKEQRLFTENNRQLEQEESRFAEEDANRLIVETEDEKDPEVEEDARRFFEELEKQEEEYLREEERQKQIEKERLKKQVEEMRRIADASKSKDENTVANVTTVQSEVKKTDDSVTINQKVNNSSGGCYIATCVYGSYDCPEVWTLRRFRDQNLDTRWYGRLLIQAYYAISPSLVRLFGRNHWFQSFWRHHLDIFVGKLRDRGYENTPYQDKY